jgi:hypothetical protein
MPFKKSNLKRNFDELQTDFNARPDISSIFSYFRRVHQFQCKSINQTSIFELLHFIRKTFVYFFIRTFFCSEYEPVGTLSLLSFATFKKFSIVELTHFRTLLSIIESEFFPFEQSKRAFIKKFSQAESTFDATNENQHNDFDLFRRHLIHTNSIHRSNFFVEEVYEIFRSYLHQCSLT